MRRQIPDRLWIQWYGDDEPHDDPVREPMWCEDKIFDSDVQYIRFEKAAYRDGEPVNLGTWIHYLVPPAAKERLMDAIDGALAEMKDRYGRIKIEEDPPVAAGEGDES